MIPMKPLVSTGRRALITERGFGPDEGDGPPTTAGPHQSAARSAAITSSPTSPRARRPRSRFVWYIAGIRIRPFPCSISAGAKAVREGCW